MQVIVAAIVLHLMGLDWLMLALAFAWLVAAIVINAWHHRMPEWLQ